MNFDNLIAKFDSGILLTAMTHIKIPQYMTSFL